MNIINNTMIESGHILVAMKDADGEDNKPITLTSYGQIIDYNEQQYGIFFSINQFNNNRRIKDNIKKICAWAIDLDNDPKPIQKDLINTSPLPPSLIIESKRGYHVYWYAEDATMRNYDHIMKALIERFNGDPRAKDLCRMLRVPDTFHWKDPANPFLITEREHNKFVYSESKMMRRFKINEQKKVHNKSYIHKSFNFNNYSEMDCVEGLNKLSGSEFVNGDIFNFKSNSDGTKQIWVNGKSSSSWINREGKIGSHDRGGPSLVQWLMWYGRSFKEALNIIEGLK